MWTQIEKTSSSDAGNNKNNNKHFIYMSSQSLFRCLTSPRVCLSARGSRSEFDLLVL